MDPNQQNSNNQNHQHNPNPNNQNQPQNQPEQPQSQQQPFPGQSPVSEPDLPPIDNNGGPKWVGWLFLALLIATIIYFTGVWGWLTDSNSPAEEPSETENTEVTEGNKNEESEEESTNENNKENNNQQEEVVDVGKGQVSVVVSAFLPGGTTLTSGTPDPNVEIRKVYLHNPENPENPWLLVYDGFRPLDLNVLNSTNEKHELISTRLVALSYDQLRLEYANLVKIDPRSNRKVAQLKTVDVDLASSIKEGEQNTVNIKFNISNPDQPQPVVEIN